MKKKILLLAVVAVCVATIASGTLAYFTHGEQVHNVITTDAVKIRVEEWQETEDGLVEYPGDAQSVMPGTRMSKIAAIRNLEAEAWIRAKYDVIITDAEGETIALSQETVDGLVSVALNSNDWLPRKGDSEWWYHAHAVAPGESTEAFFTEVVFDGPNMTNTYQNCRVQVIVSAQAVQTANNGKTVLEAHGWPEEV